MQAVGISLSSCLSALGDDPRHALADILCNHKHYFSVQDGLLPRPINVGAYQGDLFDETLDTQLAELDSRNLRFALTALAHIKAPLAQMSAGIPKQRLAVVLGTSTSGISDNQYALADKLKQGKTPTLDYPKQAMHALAQAVQCYLGWGGIAYTISTACSSSGKALAVGQRLLNSDLADVVLVGGVDTLCPLTLNGFDSLESLSATACMPCGADRDGITIGEASALFVLSRDTAPVMLQGVGESMDAWHISAPHPKGLGAYQAMARALASANLSIGDIDYLNMHGTATPQNDAMETLAISELFGDGVPVSSTKHKTGHCLGAAAAMESYICQQILLQDSTRPWLPYHYHGTLDPTLSPLNYVNEHTQSPSVRHVMSNSFAFGGSNISLIFSKS